MKLYGHINVVWLHLEANELAIILVGRCNYCDLWKSSIVDCRYKMNDVTWALVFGLNAIYEIDFFSSK